MFSKSAVLYDKIYEYSGRDYAGDAETLDALIARYRQSEGRALLDVACGTGRHLELLQEQYAVEGLDLDADMLAIARERCPNIVLHRADMVEFSLERHFDVVTCLFGSIGYACTVDRLHRAVNNMARHLRPGGVLIVEPWILPEDWQDYHVGAIFVDEPQLKIARINHSQRENQVSILDFQYLVGTPEGVEHFTERHELGLFTHDDYVDAFQCAGLHVEHDPQGLMDRGLYLGVAPLIR